MNKTWTPPGGASFTFTPRRPDDPHGGNAAKESVTTFPVDLTGAQRVRLEFDLDTRGNDVSRPGEVPNPQILLATVEKVFSLILRWKNGGLNLDLLDGEEANTFAIQPLGFRGSPLRFWVDAKIESGEVEVGARNLDDGKQIARSFSRHGGFAPPKATQLILGISRPREAWIPAWASTYSSLSLGYDVPGAQPDPQPQPEPQPPDPQPQPGQPALERLAAELAALQTQMTEVMTTLETLETRTDRQGRRIHALWQKEFGEDVED